MRTRNGVAKHRSKVRLLKAVKGFWGGRSKLSKVPREALRRAWRYAWRDRRAKKRTMRQLWITRLSAALAMRDMNYSRFMAGLRKAGITLNRKVLSELAISSPSDFDQIVDLARGQA